MEFCDECGNIMRLKEKRGTQLLMVCTVCGFEKWVENSKMDTEIQGLVIPNDEPMAFEGVIEDAEVSKRGTLVKAMCPKCGHNKAYVAVMQTRAADEPPTRIYRCEKCGHSWREYS